MRYHVRREFMSQVHTTPLSLPVCLSVSLCVYLSVSVSIWPSVCLCLCPSVWLSVFPSFSVPLAVSLSLRLAGCGEGALATSHVAGPPQGSSSPKQPSKAVSANFPPAGSSNLRLRLNGWRKGLLRFCVEPRSSALALKASARHHATCETIS